VGGGIGYHLINRDNATLKLLGGANFTRENYVEIQRNLAAGQVGEELTLKLGKSTTLLENLAFFPDLTDSGSNYRTNFSLGTVTKIAKWLGWQTNFSDATSPILPLEKKRTNSCSRLARAWHSLIQRQCVTGRIRQLPLKDAFADLARSLVDWLFIALFRRKFVFRKHSFQSLKHIRFHNPVYHLGHSPHFRGHSP